MASYQEHLARQEANRQTGTNGRDYNGPKVHFMNEFLSKEGDTAVVRFPYNTMDDIVYTDTHLVAMQGAPYGKRIRCVGAGCPFCAQGIKVDERVFIKLLVYTINEATNAVTINNVVWDRPAAFADIELKGLIEEYGASAGGLSNLLFKIKKTGSGPNTRYPILPIVNTAVYSPEIYKADFTALKDIDPEKILSKSLEQYNAAMNPASQSQPQVQTQVQAQVRVAPQAAPAPSSNGYTNAYDRVPTYNTPPMNNPVNNPVNNMGNPTAMNNQVPAFTNTPDNTPGQQMVNEPAKSGKYHF